MAVLLVMSQWVSAQIYFGYGYGMAFTSVQGLNTITDEYNEIRPWLDSKMGNFSLVDGFIMNVGASYQGIWMDMEMSFRTKKKDAYGTPPGTDVLGTRQLKLQQNAFAWTMGGMAAENGGGVGIGLRTEFGGQKIKTRVYNEGQDKGEWDKAYDNLMINLGPSLKVLLISDGGASLAFTTYYTWGLFKNNMTKFASYLNSNADPYSEQDKYGNNNRVFGFNVTFGGGFGL